MDFSRLTAYLDSLENEGIPGCDLIVYQNHAPVYRHFTGYRDAQAGIRMNGNECYWIYSASKLTTCTAAMQLVESGKIALDDPVCQYLPAFSTLTVRDDGRLRAPRARMTIRHLFAMQGGLNYDIASPSIQKAIAYSKGQADTQTIVNAIAEEPLSFDPGAHYQYSLCHDVLAAVVEVASGEKFSAYLKAHVWDALGQRDTGFTLTPALRARFAALYLYDENAHASAPHPDGEKCVYQITPAYESGGAGLLSTVADYILLMDMLAMGGVSCTGKRVLKPETIDLMRENQQTGACMDDFTRAFARVGYGYGLGVRTRVDAAVGKSPLGEFGWDGAACAYALADPQNGLSVFFATHVRNCGFGYQQVHPTIRDMVYEGMGL